jgi:hypothetical protein|tara:strand:- start:3373 stop:3531 length:159 start_codon:yes stop_codon:yes gene_type:complete
MKPSPKQTISANNYFERVVAHLIEEGYAETEQDATKIIEGMSEAWFDLIMEV